MNAGLERLNELPRQSAEEELGKCCGAVNWIRRMVEGRPYETAEQLCEAADRVWRELSPEDWLDAFRHHPKIGEKTAATGNSAEAQRWSSAEQSGTKDARAELLGELAAGNRRYEARFGFIFIVCATGKSTEEMLALLRERLQNEPGAEIRIAAEEQRKIMRLRIEKLLRGE